MKAMTVMTILVPVRCLMGPSWENQPPVSVPGRCSLCKCVVMLPCIRFHFSLSWRTWCRLNGHTHQVCTGVVLVKRKAGGEGMTMESFHEVTNVTFGKLEDHVIESYVQSGEPL